MYLIQNKTVLIFLIIIIFGVTSCREVEQNRPISKKIGVYEGPADTQLSSEIQKDLRQRGAYQSF